MSTDIERRLKAALTARAEGITPGDRRVDIVRRIAEQPAAPARSPWWRRALIPVAAASVGAVAVTGLVNGLAPRGVTVDALPATQGDFGFRGNDTAGVFYVGRDLTSVAGVSTGLPAQASWALYPHSLPASAKTGTVEQQVRAAVEQLIAGQRTAGVGNPDLFADVRVTGVAIHGDMVTVTVTPGRRAASASLATMASRAISTTAKSVVNDYYNTDTYRSGHPEVEGGALFLGHEPERLSINTPGTGLPPDSSLVFQWPDGRGTVSREFTLTGLGCLPQADMSWAIVPVDPKADLQATLAAAAGQTPVATGVIPSCATSRQAFNARVKGLPNGSYLLYAQLPGSRAAVEPLYRTFTVADGGTPKLP